MTEKKYVIYRMDVKRHNGNEFAEEASDSVRGFLIFRPNRKYSGDSLYRKLRMRF